MLKESIFLLSIVITLIIIMLLLICISFPEYAYIIYVSLPYSSNIAELFSISYFPQHPDR